MILGKNPSLLEVNNSARIVAATGVNTMLFGESGSGRELLARFIHAHSSRSQQTFVSVNCASMPKDLAESLLFGYDQGETASATDDHAGYLRSAADGTLFLNEVGELPLDVQAKLLRFLESGEVLPVGSARPVKVDARLITSSHVDLGSLVDQGSFRQDLYYRLNVVPLDIPPLCKRQGDIPLLLAHFIGLFSKRYGLKSPHFTKAALECMRHYRWPGNVRELKNLCERLLILLPGQEVGIQNLPQEFRAGPVSEGAADSMVQLPPEGIVLSNVEESLIRQALELARGNRSKAARLLGISRDTLLYRLKKFAIS
ncbi:MAG: sigma-54-dependent Fis family transcriptional regulator [Gammaproteobacteria bacterium]|nr:sigma-54-dependent Fis family transcriptional regulator [Gammaproteobacteria bacterium]